MSDKDDQEKEGNESKKRHAHFSPEIEALDKEIVVLNKQKEKSDNLIKKVDLTFDQVQGWCSKVIQKVDQQFGENISAYEHSKTLAFLFEQIA